MKTPKQPGRNPLPLDGYEVEGLALDAVEKIGPVEEQFPYVWQHDAHDESDVHAANFVAVSYDLEPDGFDEGEVQVNLSNLSGHVTTRINLTTEVAAWLSEALAKTVASRRNHVIRGHADPGPLDEPAMRAVADARFRKHGGDC